MKPMVENTKQYKDMIVYMMNTLEVLSNTKDDKFTDPIERNDRLQRIMFFNDIVYSNKEEYKTSPAYFVFRRYIAALAMTNEYTFGKNDKTIQFYTDMRYSTDNNKYDRVSYGIDITILKDSIIIVPYLDIVYMNIKSRLVFKACKIHTKNINDYTFYKIYDIIFTLIENSMLEEHPDIYDNIKNMNIFSKNIIEEMAILTVLLYMKHAVPKDDYTKFIGLEDDDTVKTIYEINKSLLDNIGTKDPNILKDALKKINNIISEL